MKCAVLGVMFLTSITLEKLRALDDGGLLFLLRGVDRLPRRSAVVLRGLEHGSGGGEGAERGDENPRLPDGPFHNTRDCKSKFY